MGDPLEADQQIVLDANALAVGQGAGHRGRDQGRDQIMVGPELPPRFGFLDHEGRQHDADLVAVERGPVAVGVARDGNRDADAIGVGVAGDDQVGPGLPGLGDRRFERSGILRVGDVVRHVGEIAVGRALRGEDVDPRKPAVSSTLATDVSPTPCSGV